ncbi:hypothetical protein MSM1_15675 [Mycobacterium sp. SM1]|nr:hypothetical protein [Mycobacterium sp. SM1]MBS4729720.1 hypothetical protein [Mycobacterium sp. SM1]
MVVEPARGMAAAVPVRARQLEAAQPEPREAAAQRELAVQPPARTLAR